MFPVVSKAKTDYHSIEDIVEHRTRLRSRFHNLKNSSYIKKEKLQSVKKFRYFESEIEEFMIILNDLCDAVPEEHLEDLVNLQAKICKHEDIDSELRARETERDVLEQMGLQMIAENHTETEIIRKKICHMKDKWQSLSSKLTDQIEILRTKQHFIEFVRNYEKFVQWMKEKVNFVSGIHHFIDLESIDKYIHDFTQMEKKIFRMEMEVEELKTTADFFIKDEYPQSYNVSQKKENLNYCWRNFKVLIQDKRKEVSELIRLHKLCCRAEEFLAWIDRKKSSISDDGYGTDLADILVLQGKNDGLVRILEQLELRLEDIMHEHDSLNPLHSEFTTGILVEKHVIQQNWLELKNKVKERRRNLKDRYIIYKLNTDVENMMAWMNELKSIISAEDISERVADGEATLETFKIYRHEIDSRKEMVDEIFLIGRGLLLPYCVHFDEVTRKLAELSKAKQSLLELLNSQENKYQERMEIQLLNRDYDIGENWLAQKEAFLYLDEDLLNSVDAIQELIEQQKEFEIIFESELQRIKFLVDDGSFSTENSENAYQKDRRRVQMDQGLEKYKAERRTSPICLRKLNVFSTFLSILDADNHHNYEDFERGKLEKFCRVLAKPDSQLTDRLMSFRSKLGKRFHLLKDALKVQLFYTDCGNVERWINEKVKIVNNKNYFDESRISANIASNGLFVNELSDYCDVIDTIKAREQELIKEKHYAVQVIQKRVKGILDCWLPLVKKIEEKISKLDEILDARCFLLITSKLELDLTEYEERVNHQYIFHDVENSTKLTVERNLESILRQVRVFQRSVHNMKTIGLQLIQRSHYDAENIAKKMENSAERYTTLIRTIEEKKKTIADGRKAGELFMDMEEQVKWMKEKTIGLSVIKTDLALVDVQHLLAKHETNTATMHSRTSEVVRLRDIAHQMISENHHDSIEIRKRVINLIDVWSQLNEQNEKFKLKLEESKRIYDYCAEAELNESFMQEKRSILSNTDFGKNEDSSAALLKRHQVIIEDLKAYGKNIDELRIKAVNCKVKKQGCEEDVPVECCPVLKKQEELKKMYDDLMSLAEERRKKLENAHKAYVLLRESAELSSWIAEKTTYAEEKNVGEDIAQVEMLQKKFDDFQSDLAERKIKLIGILTNTETLHPLLQGELAQLLFNRTEDMKTQMKHLQELIKNRNAQLNSAHELQRFYRDVDDVEEWIKEKNINLDIVDCGDSLKKIRTLLRKHEGVERDLDALDETIDRLNETASRLILKYPDAADSTASKQKGVNEKWKKLSDKAIYRKQDLLDSYDLQKFFADHDHLMSWVRKMMTVMDSIEPTSDFHSAEILKMNFQGFISEIEAYAVKVKTIDKFGEMLINSNPNVSNKIKDKLEELKLGYDLLEERKLSRKVLVDKNLEVNTFFKACEDVEIWLAHKKALLTTPGENDELVKIHRRLEQSISMKQKDISSLQDLAHKLITYCPLDKDRIVNKCDEIMMEWQSLKDAHFTMRSDLKESQTLQKFSLEAAEMENWIDERLLQATQESYRDPVNIKSKLLKHEAFEAEISTNARRVQTVLENGHRLIESEESENLKLAVQNRLENISSQWEVLMQKTSEKSEKLKEVSKQYDHIIGIKYMNFWMGDVETTLLNQDIGRDLNAVQNLLGQHKVIEEDIEAHWHKIKNLENEADSFAADSIFDIVSIKDEHNNMISRYVKLKNLAKQRKSRLNDKNTAFLLFKEIEDKTAWMGEIALRIKNENQPKFKCDRIKHSSHH